MAWDVTDDVQAFVDGGGENYGWTIVDETFWPGCNIPFTFFRTKEYGQFTPYLEVVPEPGTLGLLLLGSLVLVNRRRWYGSAGPRLPIHRPGLRRPVI